MYDGDAEKPYAAQRSRSYGTDSYSRERGRSGGRDGDGSRGFDRHAARAKRRDMRENKPVVL